MISLLNLEADPSGRCFILRIMAVEPDPPYPVSLIHLHQSRILDIRNDVLGFWFYAGRLVRIPRIDKTQGLVQFGERFTNVSDVILDRLQPLPNTPAFISDALVGKSHLSRLFINRKPGMC